MNSERPGLADEAMIANVRTLAELARTNRQVLDFSERYTPELRAAARQYAEFDGDDDSFPWGDVLEQMDEAMKARSAC